MAPGRRKGAKSGGDHREWRVGDLVLAKVKGFPAWPAKVDEPVKWGLPVEWKKVFVYFFGTQQIAFCNPADVEAFTEEKKEHLLVKRHTKDSDFVRAVHEIIDNFEMSKNEDKSMNVPLMGEVTMTDGSNSVESLADSSVKDEASKAISGTFRESTDSTKVRFDDDILVCEASAEAKQDLYRVKEATPSEDPTCNVNAKEMSLPTMYTMKNDRVTQAQNFISEKRLMSARHLKNSSHVDSHKLRNSILPSSNIIEGAGIVDRYGLRNPWGRSKRIKKSPDVSKLNDVDSPASVSSGSYEKNDSETGTVDSDTLSLNEGSTVESGYGLPQTESVVECSEGDTERIQRLDFQSSSVIVKKKRKPSRKRANSGTNELIGRLENEPELEIEEHKAGQILPSNNKDWDVKNIDEDGDEHLPLLKRARVRMGRPSSEVEEPISSVQPEEKSSEVSHCQMMPLKAPLNSEEDSPLDRNPSVGMEEFDNSSLTKTIPVKKPPHWEVKTNLGRPVDVEAALPPSKRIQRALEAMSANVSEDVQETSKGPSSMRTFVNASCFSALSDCYNMSLGNKSERDTMLRSVDLSDRVSSQDDIMGCSTNSISLEADKNPASHAEVAACNSSLSHNYIPKRTSCGTGLAVDSVDCSDCKDPASHAEVAACNSSLSLNYSPKRTSCGTGLAVDSVDCSDCKDPGVSSLSRNFPEPNAMSQRPIPLAAVSYKGLISHEGKQEDLLQHSVDNCQITNLEVEKPFKENATTGISTKNSDPVLSSVGITHCSTHDDTDLLPCNVQNICDTTNLSKLDTDKDEKDDRMFFLKKETMVKNFEVFPSSTTEARSTSLQDVPHLLRSSSYSEDHLSCKEVSGIRSSPSSNGGSDSTLVPLDNTSGCNVSVSDNIVFYSNNGCCSLDVPSPHEKPKHAGKENGKVQASAALESFKVFLRYLTRTMDRIGCATRIAIECGKLGIASEVVDVLAYNLEREPSLPKRVDLFFLVDSILQCSRGLKGEIGDTFTSAIQAQLSRFLLAAAPPGSDGQENRKQCLKVLMLWQERRVLPESVINCHIQDLDSASNPASGDPHSPRLERNERAFDDPLREVEGMVDEYGSDSSFQRPKAEDEGRDSDMANFEAVTPEHNSEKAEGQIPIALNGKHSCMLDAVDGELEMENVAPCEVELCSTGNVRVHISEQRFEQKSPVHFPPPPPKNVAPSSSPRIALPPPPPLPTPPCSALPYPVTDSKLYTNDGKQQITACSVAPRADPISVDGCYYHAPDNGDLQMKMQIPETANTGSFGSVPVPHSPIRPLISFPQVDGAMSHNKISHLRPHISESVNSCPYGGVPVSCPPIQPVNSAPQVNGAPSQKKAFNLRPPQPAPSNQFSYVKADQRKADHRTQTRDIPPQSYSNRFQFLRNRDRGNFYGVHDRFEEGLHNVGNNWSHTEPYFAGPNYHDRRRLPYAHVPYGGPQRELPLPNRSWSLPPRAINHREVMPRRPPLGGPISVASRGANYWRPSPR